MAVITSNKNSRTTNEDQCSSPAGPHLCAGGPSAGGTAAALKSLRDGKTARRFGIKKAGRIFARPGEFLRLAPYAFQIMSATVLPAGMKGMTWVEYGVITSRT